MHFSGLNTLCSFTKYVTAEVSLGNVKFIFFLSKKNLDSNMLLQHNMNYFELMDSRPWEILDRKEFILLWE